MNKVHFSSVSNEWQTPPVLFKKYDDIYHFELDAAASKDNTLCPKFFSLDSDSLLQNWFRYKTVWCNPPYGREIGKFVKKAYEESSKGCVVVMLIPSGTDTSYFHNYCFKYGKVGFLKGRIKFISKSNPKGNPAPFPSCIVIFGEKV